MDDKKQENHMNGINQNRPLLQNETPPEPENIRNYIIQRSITFENNRGFALAENPNAVDPHVTWQFTACEDTGKRDYYWGHYFSYKDTATKDFELRVTEYHKNYGLSEIDGYKYYSTQRPVDIGTFPKTDNGPFRFENFDKREDVEQGQFQAWGYLVYDAPLTQQQISDYELRPAPNNPDIVAAIQKQGEDKSQAANKLTTDKQTPSRQGNRLTAPKPIMEQLAEAEKQVQRGEAAAADKKPKRDER